MTSLSPKVSIIVPVYNVEKYLDRCMQSLLNQTMEEIEIILVDDGSPDKCPQLCDDYARYDSRIRVIHKQNEGLGMACNSGLAVATGEYIAFCDSDDWVDADMYQSLFDNAKQTNSQIVYSGLKRVDASQSVLGFLPHRDKIEIYRKNEISNLILDMIASAPSERYDRTIQVSAKVALYDRKFIIDNGVWFVSEREYPSEDLIFNINALLLAENVIVLPNFFYNYFVNHNSISSSVKPLHYKKIIETTKLINSIIENQSRFFVTQACRDELKLRIIRFLIGEARSQFWKISKSLLTYNEKKNLLLDLRLDVSAIENFERFPFNQLPLKYNLLNKIIISNWSWIISPLMKS